MCSVQEEGEAQLPRMKATVGRKCMKCDEPAVAVARTKDPFCKACFNAYFTHRFRSTIGKSRMIRDGERALLAFSGGISSRVMLALVEEGLSQRVHKKLRFVPSIIYIDEGAVLGLDWTERCRLTASVIQVAMEVGLPVYFTQLEQIFGSCTSYSVEDLMKQCDPVTREKSHVSASASVDADSNLKDGTQDSSSADDVKSKLECSSSSSPEAAASSETCTVETRTKRSPIELHSRLESFLERRDLAIETKLRELFDAVQTGTAKENLLLSLRHRLLVEIARCHGYTKVLVGDNATRLAVRLLGNVAQGRGGSLPLDTGFADVRDHDIIFTRPLREFPGREVAMYMALNGLKTVTIPSVVTLAPDKVSLEHLTETFIAGLQADFPSTVNTIFRTGDKLKVSSSLETECAKKQLSCSLCQAPLDDFDDKAVFTHLKCPTDGCTTLWESFCYGCRLTMKDTRNGDALLPPFALTGQVGTRDNQKDDHRQTMKKQIEQYILDDS